MDQNYKLDGDLLDHLENKLNELSSDTEEKFNKVIGVELAVICASMAVQLVMDGGSNEEQFLHFMSTIWRESQDENLESMINVNFLANEKKDLRLN